MALFEDTLITTVVFSYFLPSKFNLVPVDSEILTGIQTPQNQKFFKIDI